MLEIRNLSAGYSGRTIVRGIDLSVASGELLALIGPNGCGKTTLLRAISGVLSYEADRLAIDGDDARTMSSAALARRVAVVAQSAALPERFTAFQLVLMGRTPHLRLLQSESRRDAEIARNAMLRADCWDVRDRFVEVLSGGERQRVIIARALGQEPRLLLLDEPTSHLDVQHQVNTFRLMIELCRSEGLAVVAVVHDLTLASMFADRVAVMSAGEIVACGVAQDVLRPPLLESVYGVALSVVPHPTTGTPIVVPDSGDAGVQLEQRHVGAAT